MKRPRIIDCDVHHHWNSDKDLLPYLPKRWAELLLAGAPTAPPAIWPPHFFGTNVRLDSFPENGSKPGADYPTMKDQLLDPLNVRKAILTFNLGMHGGLANPYYGAALVRAANDWNRDTWLAIDDDRLCSVILASTQNPHEGANEIRRVAGHPKLVAVLLISNGLGLPFGHPVYHPIYEAAAEFNLPVAIHVAGDRGGVDQTAGGLPNSRLEMHTLMPQPLLHHMSSFITHGVFEKYPQIRLMLLEIGVGWVPWALWSLDGEYASLKAESEWVKRLPSEYFREHVRLSTQPFEAGPRRSDLIELFEAFGGMEDILCFSSDYPHWDADDPAFVAKSLPRHWRPKLYYSNAAKFFGFEVLSDEVIMDERGTLETAAGAADVS